MYGADDKDRLAQARSWFAHCSGDLALVVARKPEEYVSGNAHRLFVGGRSNMVSYLTNILRVITNVNVSIGTDGDHSEEEVDFERRKMENNTLAPEQEDSEGHTH